MFDGAVEHLSEAIRLNARYPEARYQLGIAQMSKGRPERAARNFEEAIRLKPDYADAHRSLGILLGMQGKLDQAIDGAITVRAKLNDFASSGYLSGAKLSALFANIPADKIVFSCIAKLP